MTMEERRNLLYPWDIAVWTGDQRDIIPPEEIILAGCLYSMGNIDAGDDHFTERGIEVLRGAVMAGIPTPSERALWGGPTHWKAVRKALAQAGNSNGLRKAPFHGFRLTPLASGLEGTVRTCREEIRKSRGASSEEYRRASQKIDRQANAEIGAALRERDGQGEK